VAELLGAPREEGLKAGGTGADQLAQRGVAHIAKRVNAAAKGVHRAPRPNLDPFPVRVEACAAFQNVAQLVFVEMEVQWRSSARRRLLNKERELPWVCSAVRRNVTSSPNARATVPWLAGWMVTLQATPGCGGLCFPSSSSAVCLVAWLRPT